MRRNIAWILILLVDVAYIAWGGMAAAWPDHLLGPHGTPIIAAGYEGFTRSSWPELARTSPMTTRYIDLVFRMYGIYCLVFGLMGSAIAVTALRRGDRWAWWTLLVANTIALVSAMRYDWIVNAIGPFELTEYLGLALVYGALAITTPFRAAGRLVRATV
jgi:hypothetical protein